MLNQPYFYHELIRKYVAIFGSLFNEIDIARTDQNNQQIQKFRVPISYGPREKFLAITSQKPDQKVQAIKLPRMSFEITGVQLDTQRKFGRTVKYKMTSDMIFEPIPVDIMFQLNIMCKQTLDNAKIIEQILPFFNPDWTVSVQLFADDPRVWDIPIIYTGQQHEDTYENDFITRRLQIWSIDFTMKAWLAGPIYQKKLIKFVKVNTHVGLPPNSTGVNTITAQPGLTADGEPTTDIDQTIPYTEINETDNWDYIYNLFPFEDDN